MKSYNKLIKLQFILAVLALACLTLPAAAADRWWDGGTTNIVPTGDGLSAGGAGIWDTSIINWDQGVGISHAAWNNANNDTAIFAGTAATVNLGAAITVGGLTFNSATYTLTNGNTLTLAGATPTIIANANATIGSSSVAVPTLVGTTGLTKAGNGNLTLSGNAVHTFTGGLTLNAGTLTLNLGNLATPTDLINSGNNLTLGGGTLVLTGKGSTPSTQTLGNLTINPGSSVIRTIGGSASTMNLTLGNTWTRNPGGIVNITNGIGTTVGTLTSSPALTNDIIGTWATFGPGAATRYATVSGGVIAGLTGTAAADGSGLTDTTGTTNYDLAMASGAVADLFSANTVRYAGTVDTTSPGSSFTVNGLLHAGTGVWTIGGNPVTIGADKELIVNSANNGITIAGVIQDNPSGASGLTVTGSGALTLNTANTYTGTTTINGPSTLGDGVKAIIVTSLKNAGVNSELGAGTTIALNGAIIQAGTGAASTCDRNLNIIGTCGILVKSSLVQTNTGSINGSGVLSVDGDFSASGKLVLAGSNTFTGDLVLQTDGKLTLNHANALSMATLSMSGTRIVVDLSTCNLAYILGGLKGSQNLNLGSGLAGGGSGFVSIGNNNQNNVYSGVLSGTAGLIKIGTGTETFYAPNQNTGDTKINAGAIRLEGVPALALACTVAGTGGNLNKQLTGLSSTATMFVGQSVSGVNIGGGATIASIDSATQVTLSLAGTAGATTATFTAHAGALTASTNVTVAAGAVLDVSSLNGGLTLNAGQTLGGGGTVQGDLSLANASIVSPGASVGTLTNNGNVTWQGGGIYKWEISSTGVGGQDLLLINGALTNQANSGDKFKINIVSLNGSGSPGTLAGGFNPNVDQSWKMATATGGTAGFSSDAFSFIDGFTAYNGGSGTFAVTNIGNDIRLVYKAAFVAEPPSAGTPVPAGAVKWVGDSVTFTITPTGTGPLTNRWRLNGVALPGETGTSLTLTNLQLAQSGNYDCVVSSPYPPASTSAVAVLTVNRIVVNANYRLGEDGVGANNLPADSSGSARHFLSDINGASVVVDSTSPAPYSTNYYSFNGTGGFSSIGWNPPEDNVGVECWVRVADFGQGIAHVFGTGRLNLGGIGSGINIGFDPVSGLNAQFPQQGTTVTIGLPYQPAGSSEWVHVACVRDNGQTRFYVNGVQSGAASSAVPTDSSSPFMAMGNGNGFFNGAIDEARIFTFAPGQFQQTDLGINQGLPPGTKFHPKPWFKPNPTDNYYITTKEFVTLSGWWDLWYRYRGILPFGAGVDVAQVEVSVPAVTNFTDKNFILDPLNALPAEDGHADTVGKSFYGTPIFEDANAIFEYGFGRAITNVASYDGNAFRTDVLQLQPYDNGLGDFPRTGPLPAWNSGSRQVLNMSYTGGNGGDPNNIRALDYLIDAHNVLACAAFPGGDVSYNGTLSGNLWNALVVDKNGPETKNSGGAFYENVGANYRAKPDLVSASATGGRTGGASSWATPTVSGGAAFLLEQARSTNLTHAATNNYVLKSIIMAGTSKSDLVTPIWNEFGQIIDWDLNTPYTYSNNPPAQPLDRLFGAGLFNINSSFTILTAGEQSRTATNQPIGWARGASLSSAAAHSYWFSVAKARPDFCATLVWNRHIQDNVGTSYNWSVNDLKLELYNAANQLLASSDDPGNNVEQIYLPDGIGAGLYYLKVSSHNATGENYGLAWRTAVPTAVPEALAVEPQVNGTVTVVFQGVPVQPYKLFRCDDLASDSWYQVGAGTSDNTGRVELIDAAPTPGAAFYRAQFNY